MEEMEKRHKDQKYQYLEFLCSFVVVLCIIAVYIYIFSLMGRETLIGEIIDEMIKPKFGNTGKEFHAVGLMSITIIVIIGIVIKLFELPMTGIFKATRKVWIIIMLGVGAIGLSSILLSIIGFILFPPVFLQGVILIFLLALYAAGLALFEVITLTIFMRMIKSEEY